MIPLKNSLTIVDADGQRLYFIGTSVIWVSCKKLKHHKKGIKVAILAGNPEREILLSLDCFKDWNLIHCTFPDQTVVDFIRENYNKQSTRNKFSLFKAKK